jgi:type I restriction enzyme S subunit
MEGRELPEGWTCVQLNDAGNWGSGGTPSRKNSRYYENGTIPWLVIGDLNDGEVKEFSTSITEEGLANSSAKLIPSDSLLVAMYGSIGKLGITTFPCTTNQAIAFCIPNDELISLRYLFHALANAKPELIAKGQGGAQQNISQGILKEHLIPLAPLNEQRRIAAKLDATLAAVDACRQRLDGVAAILKRFRQAVLAAATSGELTREWREERGIEKAWRPTTFGSVCEYITVGYVGKMANQYVSAGVPFLRSLNVRPFRFDEENLAYISEDFHRSISKSALAPGDLAVVRTGAPGQCCVIPDSLPEANCSDLVIARPGCDLFAEYGAIVINSSLGQGFVKSEQVGVAQAHFNVGSMKRAPLNLPSLFEQREIVRRAHVHFTLADQLEARLATSRKFIDRLTPALLAKAFRGELVPQDPNDEPASVLLERMRAASKALSARSTPSQRGRRKSLDHSELSSLTLAPVPTDDPSRLFFERTGDDITQGERAPRFVSKTKPPDFSKGGDPMQNGLIQVLDQYQGWISASMACKELGISDGSSSDDLELFYRHLKEQVEGGAVDVQRRGDEDWLKLTSRKVG